LDNVERFVENCCAVIRRNAAGRYAGVVRQAGLFSGVLG
jgi:hypothetical protein